MGLEAGDVAREQENILPDRELNVGPEWQPQPSRAGLLGLVATSLLLALSALAWIYALSHPIAIDSFVASVAGLAGLLLAALAGVWSYGYYTLQYLLGERELVIVWLWTRETIPLGRIDGVYGGHRLGKKARVDGLAWPGHYVGRARAEGLGRLKFYGTTVDPSSALLVATSTGAYAVTPDDLSGFRDRLISRLDELPEEGAERALEPSTQTPRLLQLCILSDGVVVALLAIASLLLLGSFGYVSARMPYLPELMPLHFNFMGEPDLIGPPRDAFRMPLIGMVILGFNGLVVAILRQRQRGLARIMAMATLMVELVMLVAVLRVVR